jgi:hypothetical protein
MAPNNARPTFSQELQERLGKYEDSDVEFKIQGVDLVTRESDPALFTIAPKAATAQDTAPTDAPPGLHVRFKGPALKSDVVLLSGAFGIRDGAVFVGELATVEVNGHRVVFSNGSWREKR